MSKFLLLILLSVASLSALEWKSYDMALKEQKLSHKPIMIDVVRTGCHYCSKMEKNVFEDKEMAKWIEKRFIPVKLDLDTDRLPLGITVMFTPTFYFVNSKQEIIKRVPGSWNIQDFKDLTENIK